MSNLKLILTILSFSFNSCWSSDKNQKLSTIATIWTWHDIFAEAREDSFKSPALPEQELKTPPGLFKSPALPEQELKTPPGLFRPPFLMPQIVWDYRFNCWVQILVPAQPY